MRYDLIIIGSGPAGISAALTAKNRNLNFLLFGTDDVSFKVGKTGLVTNYLGIPNITGPELGRIFLNQLNGAGIEIRKQRIAAVYSMGSYFALQAGQDMLETTTVILAGGAATAKPLPGETEFLGRGVSYCATCDAALYKGRPVLVAGSGAEAVEEAEFLKSTASSVTYVPLSRHDAVPQASVNLSVLSEHPSAIEKGQGSMVLVTDQGRHPADCIFILRESIAPSQLVPGLELDGNFIKTDRKMQTNLPGLFAAGDITGLPFQYMKAAGEGNVAAISASEFITRAKLKA